MKDVEYTGRANTASLAINDREYEWAGHGDVVAMRNDDADELVGKDPRFAFAEGQFGDEDEEFTEEFEDDSLPETPDDD